MRGFHNIISRKVPKEHSSLQKPVHPPKTVGGAAGGTQQEDGAEVAKIVRMGKTAEGPIYQVYGIRLLVGLVQ